MSGHRRMTRAFVGSVITAVAIAASVTVNGTAGADDGPFSPRGISGCFHPFSDYVDSRWSDAEVSGHTRTKDGTIRYRTPDNHIHHMPVEIQVRSVDGETEWRVLPDDEKDDGPMGASPSCAMRHWQSI